MLVGQKITKSVIKSDKRKQKKYSATITVLYNKITDENGYISTITEDKIGSNINWKVLGTQDQFETACPLCRRRSRETANLIIPLHEHKDFK